MRKYYYLLAQISLLISSNLLADEKDNKLVEEYCACVKASNQELQNAVDKIKSGDMIGASQILQNMQGQIKETETCTKELQTKHSTLSLPDEEKKRFEEQIKKTCPTPSVEGLEQRTYQKHE